MAWKNIPGKTGWQFRDDPVNPGFKRSALHNKQTDGVRTRGLNQVYAETKKTTDPDGKNRGEISATFYNKEVKPASFFSSLPAVGGGGGAGSDPDFANVIGLYKTPSNGSISDASGTLGPFIIGTGAVIDGTQTQFQPANINLSGGGYVEAQGDLTQVDFGDDPFTIETWIYRTAAGTVGDNGPPEYDTIVSASVFGSAGWGIFIRQDTNRLVYERGDNGALFEGDANAVISNNTWTHVAVSSEGVGGNLRLFVNGVLAGTLSAPSGQDTSPSLTRLGIGRYQADRRKRFIGHIEDVRLTKGVARYTEAFTPPTAEFRGAAQPSLIGNYTYDPEFGYCVGILNVNTSFESAPRTKQDFGIPADGLTMTLDSIMTDADYVTVMSDATHVSFDIVSPTGSPQNTLPSERNTDGVVFTKAAITTVPNVSGTSTTTAENLGRETVTVGGIRTFWHDEDTGNDFQTSDQSGFVFRSNELRLYANSFLGSNDIQQRGNTGVAGGTSTGDYINWDADQYLLVWVTNSAVAPVLS